MGGVTILDGGMGKELRRIGAPFRQPEWSSLALIEAPEMVVRAHRNFVEAGAQVIITNNYAVVPYHHTQEFFDERGVELTDLAGRLAREAADAPGHDVRVAGSMPPLFGSYEPDRFDAEPALAMYVDIARALEPYVDLWVAETISSIAEMTSILAAIAAIGSGKPVWLSFAVPDRWTRVGVALRSGETPTQIVDAIPPGSVEAVLVNCSTPEQTGPALDAFHLALTDAGTTVSSGAYANAFSTTHRADSAAANEFIHERRDDLTAEVYADFVAEWVGAGATIVGGCCDMYPEHIAALAERFASPPAPGASDARR